MKITKEDGELHLRLGAGTYELKINADGSFVLTGSILLGIETTGGAGHAGMPGAGGHSGRGGAGGAPGQAGMPGAGGYGGRGGAGGAPGEGGMPGAGGYGGRGGAGGRARPTDFDDINK